MIFLFHNLPACKADNKKVKILPFVSIFIALLHSQFNYVFSLLFSAPQFKSKYLNKNRGKIKLFLQIRCEISCRWKRCPQIPQISSPHCRLLATLQMKLAASIFKTLFWNNTRWLVAHQAIKQKGEIVYKRFHNYYFLSGYPNKNFCIRPC